MIYWRWFNRRHHPLARLIGGAIGLVLLVGLLTLGFFALIAFAFIGAIVALTRSLARHAHAHTQTRTAAHPHVLEGEYVVLRNPTSQIKQ